MFGAFAAAAIGPPPSARHSRASRVDFIGSMNRRKVGAGVGEGEARVRGPLVLPDDPGWQNERAPVRASMSS